MASLRNDKLSRGEESGESTRNAGRRRGGGRSSTQTRTRNVKPAQRPHTRTLISIEMANDNFSMSSHLIYDVPAILTTRSKNVAADSLSDRFYSSLLAPSWPISRTWTTLVRSLSASRLALASQQQPTAVDAYGRPRGALHRLWESRRRRELLTIDRRKGSAAGRISRISDALRMYIAHEDPCAIDTRLQGIDIKGGRILSIK
ncbi:hypothetical protein ALC62_01319 [Cyphomyrmex costatus]|uniref:Uncharacterized protein n=1 Tax=Cyphomyrmex costatus TaxID=456900 RepID=A0A195D4J5_9HYME|nr:hypothetical protein ALC62_01319 [Cyphomyrmex costatus]